MLPHLDERQRRLYLGSEARALGDGGVGVGGAGVGGAAEARCRRGRRAGGGGGAAGGPGPAAGRGPEARGEADPRLVPALLALVEDGKRGDPMSPLAWTMKSLRNLAGELARQGHPVRQETVARLLRGQGFSLQASAKTLEGRQHPDRDAQFRYINAQVDGDLAAGQPVISVDAKKKEQVGPFAGTAGSGARRATRCRSATTTSPTRSWARRSRTGSTTSPRNAGWVTVGHRPRHRRVRGGDASAAGGSGRAGSATRRPRRLLITADAGGSNGYRPGLEGRARGPGRRDRAGDHRLPLPARDLEVEQDRAPAVLPHHDELARPAR